MTDAIERLRGLIHRYWELAYAEGKEGRECDTPEGDAQKTLTEIDSILRAISNAAQGVVSSRKEDWIAENHYDYWVVRVLCADIPRFYSIRKSDGQMLELPHKDSPFVPFPAVARNEGEVIAGAVGKAKSVAGTLRLYAREDQNWNATMLRSVMDTCADRLDDIAEIASSGPGGGVDLRLADTLALWKSNAADAAFSPDVRGAYMECTAMLEAAISGKPYKSPF